MPYDALEWPPNLRSAGLAHAAAVAAALFVGLIPTLGLAADASPVYRFYNNLTGTHFYTIAAGERDAVVASYPQFIYEGAVFWAYVDAATGTLPVYRFYNTQLGTHFYTQSETEKTYVIANYPVFTYEGPVYYAPPTGDFAGSTALFRFYNTLTGAHFFTSDVAERDHVLATWPWFAYEGTAYFVLTGPNSGGSSGTNAAPKATLSVSSSVVSTPATVTLTATASDTDGTIVKVQFYDGGTMIGEAASAPYTYDYPITTAGTYDLSAAAIDDKGASGTSNVVQVVANAVGGGTVPRVQTAAPPYSLGYIGCSNTHDVIEGYHAATGSRHLFWPFAGYPIEGQTVFKWSDPASSYWAYFDMMKARHDPGGGPEIVWVQLCENLAPTSANYHVTTQDDVARMLANVRAHAPNATLYISPLQAYSPPTICPGMGPMGEGIPRLTALADWAVDQGLAHPGPGAKGYAPLGPLTTATLHSDNCHPSGPAHGEPMTNSGELLLGGQLALVF